MPRTKSNTPGTGFAEPLYHANRGVKYKYRTQMGMVPSNEFLHFFDDFSNAVASNAPAGWTAIIDTGATCTSGDEQGGVLNITSDGVDEGVALYLNKQVQLTGKKFFMEARVKLEDADDNVVVIGLTDGAATTNPEDLYDASTTDVIAFGTLTDGDATPVLRTDKDGTGPTNDTSDTDLEDDTWHILAIAYNGAADPTAGSVSAYLDGALVATASVDTTIPEDVVLAPFVAGLVEDDATDVIKVDYVRFVVER